MREKIIGGKGWERMTMKQLKALPADTLIHAKAYRGCSGFYSLWIDNKRSGEKRDEAIEFVMFTRLDYLFLRWEFKIIHKKTRRHDGH